MPRWRRLFVVLQLAVAIVVLATSALLFQSAATLARVNPSFTPEGVSAFDFVLPDSRYGTPARRVEFHRRLLDAVVDVPGVRSATVVDVVLFGESTTILNLTVENQVVADPSMRPRAARRTVSPSYFDVLSIPGIDGRGFATSDETAEASVAIVNEAFVRRYMNGGSTLGRRIKRGQPASKNPWMTIVGVVGSVRGAGLGVDPQPEVSCRTWSWRRA